MVKISGKPQRWRTEFVDRSDGAETSSDSDAALTDAQKLARAKATQKLIDELAYTDSEEEKHQVESSRGKSKLLWSDDEDGNEGAAVYERFKNRKNLKRKQRPGPKTATSDRQKQIGANSKRQVQKEYGDKTDEENDDAIADRIPDYLKRRRHEFEDNKAQLDQAGLKLPPTYDDVGFSDDERLESLAEKPVFPLLKPPNPYQDIQLPYSLGVIPAPIAQWLKKYQVEGTAFLHELFIYQKGGILGDDMGLGKTIQVIAALTAAFGKTGDERDAKRMRKVRRAVGTRWYPVVLIVCPGVLMDNWRYELNTWGWWTVYTYHGSVDEKEVALKAALSGRLEIMITTYTTYKLNKDAINQVQWDCVIADECHIIKERKSENTKAMDEINALCRIGLTGTAIQNKYDELWTLLNWTNPGRFGPLNAWKMNISDPLKNGQAHDASVAQLSKARKTAKKLVQNLLPQFFLRRMKTLISDQLPKKTDRVVFCPLTSTQADAYENFIEGEVVQLIRTSTELCNCGSGKKRGWCCGMYLENGDKWQSHVFPAIATLRSLSNHLGLLIPSSTNDKDRLNKELDVLKTIRPHEWQDLYRNRDNIVTLANREFCGKWLVLNKLLKFWYGEGDKVLVFSHSVRLLRLLQLLFQNTAYNVSYLDGSMSYADRAKTVDDFNADATQFVFLISTRAGGVGLNITSANKVVVVDPNWNPSYDLQAQDRAYRIGQTRDVEVFRLVSVGTIEEIVYARQIYKQQQANIGYTASLERRYFTGVQASKKKGEIFGLQNLLSYQGENIVLRDIVNKTNIAESRAGVQVVGLDLASQESEEGDMFKGKDEDNEDAAMSQLAVLISNGNAPEEGWNETKPKPQKTDAIQGILAGAGVQYTHSNAEVVGSSKIEARLSKRAEEAGNDRDEQVFAESQASQSQSYSHTDGQEDQRLVAGTDVDTSIDAGSGTTDSRSRSMKKVAFRYRPSQEIRKRQFCTMAKTFGYEDVTQFAFAVESWTQERRRECLDKFYDMLRKGEITTEQG